MSVELLQHNLERFGVVTVMDAVLYDYSSGRVVADLDTLKLSNITSEAQVKEIKGGRFADLLVAYNWGRTLNLEFQDALLSLNTMKALWAAEIERDASKIIEHKKGTFKLSGTKTVTLGAVADVDSVINVSKGVEYTWHDGKGAAPAESYTFVKSTGVITIVHTESATNDDILVYYSVAMSNPATGWEPVQAVLKSTRFPGTVKFVGKTILVNAETGKTIEAEIVIPKLKLASNFTLGMEAEGDASVFDFSGMAMINEDKELLIIKNLRYLD